HPGRTNCRHRRSLARPGRDCGARAHGVDGPVRPDAAPTRVPGGGRPLALMRGPTGNSADQRAGTAPPFFRVEQGLTATFDAKERGMRGCTGGLTLSALTPTCHRSG